MRCQTATACCCHYIRSQIPHLQRVRFSLRLLRVKAAKHSLNRTTNLCFRIAYVKALLPISTNRLHAKPSQLRPRRILRQPVTTFNPARHETPPHSLLICMTPTMARVLNGLLNYEQESKTVPFDHQFSKHHPREVFSSGTRVTL